MLSICRVKENTWPGQGDRIGAKVIRVYKFSTILHRIYVRFNYPSHVWIYTLFPLGWYLQLSVWTLTWGPLFLWGCFWDHPWSHPVHALHTLVPHILFWCRGEVYQHQGALCRCLRFQQHYPLTKEFMEKAFLDLRGISYSWGLTLVLGFTSNLRRL